MTPSAAIHGTGELIARLERRAERERKARLEAENLLEVKSRELYGANQQLTQLAADLERRVEARTHELVEERERALGLADRIARSEKEIARHVERLEAALANMARGLSMFDAEGRLIICNEMYREIYNLPMSLTRPGTSLAKIVRHHVKQEGRRKDPKHIDEERAWIENHMAELARGKSRTYTQNLGDGRIINVTCQPLQNGGWVDVQEDVTEKHSYARMLEQRVAEKTREIAEQSAELKRSNLELEQFAYVASHDLQEPLRAVTGFLDLLKSRYASRLDAEADEFIGFAVDGAIRMQTLIDDLIAYSRVSTKGQTLEPTDCKGVVDRSLANLRAACEHSAAVITRDPLPTLRADASQLTRLFQNLLGNALKFKSTRRPEIHIGASRLDNGWEFSVRDNGIGIDGKHIQQLFVIFNRLHTRAEYPGNGIGLAICKRIVERHGGRIWINSLPGRGTTVHFTLSDHGLCHTPPSTPAAAEGEPQCSMQ